jgi:hypothetical protein
MSPDLRDWLVSLACTAAAVFCGYVLATLKPPYPIDQHVYDDDDFKHGEDVTK